MIFSQNLKNFSRKKNPVQKLIQFFIVAKGIIISGQVGLETSHQMIEQCGE